MPQIKTMYKMLDLLKLNHQEGLCSSDFSRLGVDYRSAKVILDLLEKEGRVIRTGKRWLLISKNNEVGKSEKKKQN